MNNKFSQTIFQLRKEKNLKQIELAKILNTTQRKISYWENNKVEPDIDTLCEIADYFDISIDELVGRN